MSPRILALGLVALPAAGFSQVVSYSTAGVAYSQNFNGLAQSGSGSVATQNTTALTAISGVTNTGVNGWYFRNDRGSSTSSEFRAQDGSLSGSTGRGVISFGTTGSTDRALGILATSNQISTFGVFLRNDTGFTLSSVTLSYTGEQWRVGDTGVSDKLKFGQRTYASVASAVIGDAVGYNLLSALDFNSPIIGTSGLNNSALNGNLAANQALLSATFLVNWLPNEILALQWVGNDESGQDSGLAIDNLSVSAIPEPSTYATLLGGLALGFAALRRRAHSVTTLVR